MRSQDNGKNNQLPDHQADGSDQRRQQVFNALADRYDDEIGMDETVMGLSLLRRWHLRRARGEVLEVAVGTGRNFHCYPPGCRVTATDACPNMAQKALEKAKALGGGGGAKVVGVGVMDGTALAFPSGRFDTVVDTHGLCSVAEPRRLLREMSRVARPDGQILLLEHGRSHYGWLNGLLDKYASRHLEKWGCSWNRDIEGLVREAGLSVESSSRWHFGTTYLLVCRKKEGTAAKEEGEREEGNGKEEKQPQQRIAEEEEGPAPRRRGGNK